MGPLCPRTRMGAIQTHRGRKLGLPRRARRNGFHLHLWHALYTPVFPMTWGYCVSTVSTGRDPAPSLLQTSLLLFPPPSARWSVLPPGVWSLSEDSHTQAGSDRVTPSLESVMTLIVTNSCWVPLIGLSSTKLIPFPASLLSSTHI